MSDIKRYKISCSDCDPYLEESQEGDWVRYVDVVGVIRAENEALLKILREWRDYADHGRVPSDECLDATDIALCGEGES